MNVFLKNTEKKRLIFLFSFSSNTDNKREPYKLIKNGNPISPQYRLECLKERKCIQSLQVKNRAVRNCTSSLFNLIEYRVLVKLLCQFKNIEFRWIHLCAVHNIVRVLLAKKYLPLRKEKQMQQLLSSWV